jgi:hypothetical protein
MAITQVITNKPDYLLLIDDGRISNKQEFLDLCIDAITKALQHGQKRLLLDNRTLSIELTRPEVLEVADQLKEMNAQELGFRFAVISSRGSSRIARFVETSFTARSAIYKRFESQREALSWLLA